MVGIVYASRREAEPFLSRMSAEPLGTQPWLLFQTSGQGHRSSIAVVSGMGKVAAAMAATHLVLVQRVSVLVNAGLCGRTAGLWATCFESALPLKATVTGSVRQNKPWPATADGSGG